MAQAAHFVLERGVVQGPLQGQLKHVKGQRFGQVVIGPGLEGLYRPGHIRVGRHDQNGNGRIIGLDGPGGLHAIHAAHAHIHQDKIKGPFAAEGHGGLAVVQACGGVAPFFQ